MPPIGACSSQPLDSIDVDREAPASIAEVPAAFAEGFCNALSICCVDLGFNFDLADCKQDVTADLADELGRYDGLDLDFYPDSAAACIEDYSDFVCLDGPTTTVSVKQNCELMVRGRQAPGEPCEDELECWQGPGGNASCDFQPDGSSICRVSSGPIHAQRSEPCGGTCKDSSYGSDGCESVFVGRNDPPANFSLPLCYTSDGLQCAGVAGSPRACAPLVPIGQSCAGNSVSCEADAFCTFDTEVCEAQRTSGPCDELNDACASNAFCDSEHGLCVLLRKLIGHACASDEECESLYCNPAGVCQWPTPESACAEYVRGVPGN